MDLSTVNILIGSGIVLISSLIGAGIASRRDVSAEKRRIQAEHLTLLRDAYVEVLSFLYQFTFVVTWNAFKPSDPSVARSYVEQGNKLRAKLTLISTVEVLDAYREVLYLGNDVLDEVKMEMSQPAKIEPQTSDSDTAKKRYNDKIAFLSIKMRQHLETLEKGSVK